MYFVSLCVFLEYKYDYIKKYMILDKFDTDTCLLLLRMWILTFEFDMLKKDDLSLQARAEPVQLVEQSQTWPEDRKQKTSVRQRYEIITTNSLLEYKPHDKQFISLDLQNLTHS